jgi:hypothetical protein
MTAHFSEEWVPNSEVEFWSISEAAFSILPRLHGNDHKPLQSFKNWMTEVKINSQFSLCGLSDWPLVFNILFLIHLPVSFNMQISKKKNKTQHKCYGTSWKKPPQKHSTTLFNTYQH